jgi:hypothetical protein
MAKRVFSSILILFLLALGACTEKSPSNAPSHSAYNSLWESFSTPPKSAKPWCYWWWINGHADRKTIVADLESMKALGFGGVLMFDSRGYHDNEEHVINPKPEIGWGTDKWYDLVEFAIRESARLGLEFTLNASASGGTLNGFVDGKEYETDVTDRSAVIAHLDRTVGPILKRVPELVGTTFTHIYSVSYEGNVKTGGTWQTIKDTFYATMREWAHSHGLKVYSESGGPWMWGSKATKLDCNQLDMLAHNDFPQGEFWPLKEQCTVPYGGHANANGRFFQRAIVLAARREGRKIVSMEAFTHMHRHYSVDPAFLKPLADIAYADGANRLVWHTFTCSPEKFGIPGAEYFAGSHINRNVTWQKDASAFVNYLSRCQALLQRGEHVDDGEFLNIETNYYGWGRFRKDANAKFTTTHRKENNVDFFFVAGEGKTNVTLAASSEQRCVEIWDPVFATREKARWKPIGGNKTNVELDLPIGGSCFVVFAPDCQATEKTAKKEIDELDAPWQVSFAYHPGIKATPPEDVTMESLRDWTGFGKDGNAKSTEIRYFSGTATYRTKAEITGTSTKEKFRISLGPVPTGVARISVNGIDCGVAWCAPWEIDVSRAIREGANEIEIRYTNNWFNRLVGDCILNPEDRVTLSTLRYSREPRVKSDPKRPWLPLPTIYSGPSAYDPLQPSGLLGPVCIIRTR